MSENTCVFSFDSTGLNPSPPEASTQEVASSDALLWGFQGQREAMELLLCIIVRRLTVDSARAKPSGPEPDCAIVTGNRDLGARVRGRAGQPAENH